MATILIVDDHPTNREYLVTLLGYGGHRLLQAADGAEALTVARAEHPDLVISDILMPVMDGYEFVRQLRATAQIAATPVIFYTANYQGWEARSLAEACGVSQVLIKPVEPEVMLRAVEAALAAAPALPSAPSGEEFEVEHLRVLTDKLSQKTEELQHANDRLTALVELGLQLGSERDPRRLLQCFCDTAREIIGAQYAAVGILTSDGTTLRHYLTSGLEAGAAAQLGTPRADDPFLSALVREERHIRRQSPDERPQRFAAGLPPGHSLLGTRIVSPARHYGWVCLLNKVEGAEFSAEDERLVGMLAAQVGRVYENGSLYADLHRHATDLEQEVRERQRVEAGLRENEALFRGAFEHTNLASVLLDLNNTFLRVNSAFARMFGYSQAEMIGMTMADITHPEHLAESYARREELLRGGGNFFQMEKRYFRKDGSILWGLTNVALLRDAEGRPELYVGQVQDITERKALEDQFRQSQERLRHVVSTSPAVLFTLDAAHDDLHLTWISENVRELLGFDLEQVYEPDWWTRRFHPEDGEIFLARLQRELYSQDRFAGEFRFRHQNHQYRWMRSEMRLLRDEGGNPLEIVGSLSDITERRGLEDQFRQAQKMEAVGRLAGGVAHDFNNLLCVINGYSSILLATLPPHSNAREAISEVAAAGDRAAALTRQLLVFSRKSLVEPRVLDLGAVVENIHSMLRRLIGEDIQLTTEIEPALGTVMADPGYVEQVLLNLAVNARDAMPLGGTLHIRVCNEELDAEYAGRADGQAGRYVRLSVADSGCGMDAATLERIWEPFFSTKGERGTGLGLATVYGIVKQSAGQVDVTSEVGVGTTFNVYFPRLDNPDAEEEVEAGPPVLPRGTESILLVEDEEGVRALARQILESVGYAVFTAADGREAMQVLAERGNRIDLLLTDVVMPRMSGRELAEHVRAAHPRMAVLFVSGYTDDAVVRHGIQQAEVEFLQKPFSAASLTTKVRAVLDQNSQCR